ncbi:transmembrane protease serine 11E-like [Aricia agestis]|uniref:transmembrane protease serine 11E-like n=1 Tax=Aricia agestis TaxID=91739 RepID=UPI001C208673|nr:transmembrane protease serine 11E-like [Aricia agestis]
MLTPLSKILFKQVRKIHGLSRIGNRDVVGFGINGSANYKDDPHFPFPAVRFKENTEDICALREKEKGDWKLLTCAEKRALYRASFCQTFAEFQHPTGQWKFILGWALFLSSYCFWSAMFYHCYVYEKLPLSFCKESREAQLRRMLDLHVNPVDGLSSKWDYEQDCWKVAIVLALIGLALAHPSGYGISLAQPLVLPSAVSVSSSIINHGYSIPRITSIPIITPIIKPIIATPIIKPIISFSQMIFRLLMCLVATSEVHSSDEDNTDTISDDMYLENMRRSLAEWQYEGLPIEAPESARRAGSDVGDKPVNITSHRYLSPELRYRGYEQTYADIREYPYIAAMLMNDQMWCTGVIIAPDKILADAYCLQLQYMNRFNRELVKVLNIRVGSDNATAGGKLYKASEIFFHPNYKPHILEFNFAIVKISRNISFATMKDADVAKYSHRTYIPADDDNIIFVGWGTVYAIEDGGKIIVLKKFKVPVYNLADCQDIHGRDVVTSANFCAGFISQAKNICHHDMGGAAIQGGEVVGLLSFASKYCDHPDKPAVFSTVGRVADWIESIK